MEKLAGCQHDDEYWVAIEDHWLAFKYKYDKACLLGVNCNGGFD